MNANKLIKLTAAKDKRAFEQLYNNYKGLVFAVAAAITKQREDAEDIVVDTFIQVYNKASMFNNGSGKAWIASIGRNLALNHIKRKKKETLTDFSDERVLGESQDIADSIIDNSVLSAALNQLSESEREVVMLYNSGLKHKEIALVTAEPIGTVTWRYKNALHKLKIALTCKGGAYER